MRSDGAGNQQESKSILCTDYFRSVVCIFCHFKSNYCACDKANKKELGWGLSGLLVCWSGETLRQKHNGQTRHNKLTWILLSSSYDHHFSSLSESSTTIIDCQSLWWPSRVLWAGCCGGVCGRGVLGVSHYVVGAILWYRWLEFGFGGCGGFRGPIRIHAKLLGQVHVKSLWNSFPPTAQPGQTSVSP